MPKPHKFAYTSEETTLKHARCLSRPSSQRDSPLFRLPLELREEIYRYALPSSSRTTEAAKSRFGFSLDHSSSDEDEDEVEEVDYLPWACRIPLCTWTRGSLTLLRSCKRIYSEASIVFYKYNTFDLNIEDDEPELIVRYERPSNLKIRKMSSIKREQLRCVQAWCLNFYSHESFEASETSSLKEFHGLWITKVRPAYPYGLYRYDYCRQESERSRSTDKILSGLMKWLEVIGLEGYQKMHHLELSFLPKDEETSLPDPRLFDAVIGSIPSAVLDRVCQVNAGHSSKVRKVGKIGKRGAVPFSPWIRTSRSRRH